MSIQTISLMMPLKLGSVNCHLLKQENNFMLIDTGSSNARAQLEQELETAGCKPGMLKLIVLTHGDFDHTGNASHLSQKYGVPVAMHKDDRLMAEEGDMFFNRKQPNIIIRKLVPLLSGFSKKQHFKPDLFIEDGFDFAEYGFLAKALSIPGHSKGSLGILLASGELFCGDLFENRDKPALNSIMDDVETAKASIEKLKGYEITTVYPGHGQPFSMAQFIASN